MRDNCVWKHLKHVGHSGMYIGDCQLVINMAIHGVSSAARSSSNFNADLWRWVHELKCDRGEHASGARKTKAHRPRSEAMASDDDPIQQWVGNGLADRAAKDLARTAGGADHRAKTLTEARASAQEVIKRAAIAVAWTMKRWPELGPKKSTRARKKHKGASTDCNGHTFEERGEGAWECSRCRRWARGAQARKNLIRRRCPGTLFDQAHPSHRLQLDVGVVWCTRCGAFAARLPRALLRACAGRPRSAAHWTHLRRLRRGLAPTTAAYFGEASGWARWRNIEPEVADETDSALGEAGSDGVPRNSGLQKRGRQRLAAV